MDKRHVVFCDNVGRPMLRYEESFFEKELKDIVVGGACADLHHQLDVSYPVHNGIVQNWEDMCHMWDHAFFSLLTGLVIDTGDGVTHVVPVIDGYSFPHLIKRMNEAGRHITFYLVGLFSRRGYSMNRTSDFESVREIKEKLCYISYDYKREYQLGLETTILVKTYTMEGSSKLARFQAPEALFTPELIDVEGDGMADLVFRCIQEMDIDNRIMIYQHIVLSGGSSMYPGFPSSLEKEILDRYLDLVLKGNKDDLKKLRLRIEDPPRRNHMVYLGGAVLAGIMKDAPEFWISKEDYLEEGINCLSAARRDARWSICNSICQFTRTRGDISVVELQQPIAMEDFEIKDSVVRFKVRRGRPTLVSPAAETEKVLPLAGGLNISLEGKIVVDSTEDGAVYVEAVSNCRLGEIGDITQPDPDILGKLVYDIPHANTTLEMPSLAAQVTKFKCEGFMLSLFMNHCMLNGIGVMEFISHGTKSR